VRVYDRPGFLGSINGNWGTEGNWGSGLYARINDAAVFNRPVATTAITIAGVSKEAREVYFDHPELPSFTFAPRSDSPNAILRLGSGGAGAITLNHTVPSAQIFDLPIVAARRLTLSNFSFKPGALLDIRGPIRADTAGEGLLFFNDGPVIARAPIESSIGQVDKYGNGEATLAAANAHTGITRVARGSLVVAANGALGTVGAGTEIVSGATLALAGVNYTDLEPLSLAGTGVAGSAGTLEARGAGTSSFAGPITIAAHTTVGARDSGSSLSLPGTIGTSTTSLDLTLAGAGHTEISGPISGVRNLYVRGPGVARLSNSSSTYGASATVYVTSGTLLIPVDAPNSAPGPLGASTFRVRVGSTLSQPGDDAALLTEGAVTIGRPLQIEPNNHPGVSKIGGSTPHLSVFAGGVFLGRELTVEAVEGGEVLIQGAVVDLNTAGSVRKTGPGLVRLSGTNTYSGTTTVEQGILRINQAASLPGSTTLTIHSGGVFDLNGFGRSIAGFTLEGGELIDSADLTSTFLSIGSGQPFALRSGRVFTRLGGMSGVIKSTDGVARLAGTNTYQGATSVEAGTLLVDGSTNELSAVSVTGGWLGGSGTIGGSVSVGQHGGLAFSLATPPAGHQALAIGGALSFAAGARMQVTIAEGVEAGTYTLANAAGEVSGPLPSLELPSGWSGELSSVGGALRVTLVQSGVPAIAAWRLQYFDSAEPIGIAADDADPDGDGVPNLLEYALGGNPLSADPSVLPQPVTSGNRLALVVSRVPDPLLLYIVEAAGDLAAANWTPIWSSSGEENGGGAVTVVDAITLDEAPRRFLRLRVEYGE
jgi:autotransporter-associated beta strand protein